MASAQDNPTPTVFITNEKSAITLMELSKGDEREPVDAAEVFDLLRHLLDPEHPELTLEQLKVVELDKINVRGRVINVQFTPTVPTCSVATLIGLTLKTKLIHSMPRRYLVNVSVFPKAHDLEDAINKQLADKERVCAALENPNLVTVINKGILGTDILDASFHKFWNSPVDVA